MAILFVGAGHDSKKNKKYVFKGVDVWVAILFLGAGQHPKNTKNVVLNIFDGWDVPSRRFKRLIKSLDIPERRFKGSENPWMSLKGVLRAA